MTRTITSLLGLFFLVGTDAQMRRSLLIAIALTIAVLPARADFGAGGQMLGFWSGAAVETMVYITETDDTNDTFTFPATVETGDLLIAYDVARNDPVVVVPSGFTSISQVKGQTADDTQVVISYKIADGTEDGGSLTGMNGADADNKCLLQFRGNVPVGGLTVSTPTTETTAGNPAAQTVTASAGRVPVLGIGTSAANAATTLTCASCDAISQCGSGQPDIGYLTQEAAPADFTVDMGDSGNDNILISFYIHAFQ